MDAYELLNAWYPGCGWGDWRSRMIDPAPVQCGGEVYLDLPQAGKYLGLKPDRLKALCREKRIPHARLDYRTFRFKRSDLDAYLTQFYKHSRSGF